MITQRRINKKKIRSLFKKAIAIPNIKSKVIKIKISILVYYPNKFMTYFVLSKLTINLFLSYFYSLLVKYVILSDISIFLIKIFEYLLAIL